MLFRFCLYGFLKNQEYFDPFLILALREKGLSFFTIGLLIAFREVCVNILEIPTGAIADVFGRRKSMIFGFAAYIVSFTLFGFASNLALLFGAMWFYAIGDAFRSGTHKSMIFTWLRLNGRESERTKIYGLTRSWSKIGSAVSVVLASVFVFVSSRYTDIFFYAIIPYVLSIVNMLGYPRELDGEREDISVRGAFLHVVESVKASAKAGPLRGLVVESMGFEGYFSMAKEYLQPVLKATALTAAAGWAFASGLAEP
ncbi:MAG: MFS transporter, partial [Candidatus Poribacteria bacterium]|nr:MFS transporter [Candidatus Poribacteria bacterium]